MASKRKLAAHPYRAHAFEPLLAQIDAMYPNRSKTSGPDGWLGDKAHQGRKSDHNPRPSGIVLAQDISHDPRNGFDSYKFADRLISEGYQDPRLRYVISDERIAGNEEFCKANGGEPWQWREYHGENKHDKHMHIGLVRDEDVANQTQAWNIGERMPDNPDNSEAHIYPVLRKGAQGEDVVALQRLLGIDMDGDFGPQTLTAVEDFQASHGLIDDGVVGPYTWDTLAKAYKPVPAPPEPEPTPDPSPGPQNGFSVAADLPGYNQDRINEVVEGHAMVHYDWHGRGPAPIGYLKGVASSFARAICYYRMRKEPWVSMAHAETGNNLDALNWYRNQFRAAGMSNERSGEDTLRHVFVLLLGLGMRESSGLYTEGRDMSAHNITGENAEGGAFQTSWDIRSKAPAVVKLFEMYKEAGDGILLDVYSEGVNHSMSSDYGDGDGREFQHLAKHSPDFAAQVAAIGMRTMRAHWGPLNRREAVVLSSADDMLKQVQNTLNEGALTS
jgi:hypothetical protein